MTLNPSAINTLALINGNLTQRTQKKSGAKLTKDSIEDRMARGVFYNVSYVLKGKKGSTKSLKMAKNEVPPSLFTPSRTANVLEVTRKEGNTIRRVDIEQTITELFMYNVELMICGKFNDIRTFANQFGAAFTEGALVCALDFAPYQDENGRIVFPEANTLATRTFLAVSAAYVARKDVTKRKYDGVVVDRMAISAENPDLVLKLWNHRSDLKIDVSVKRRIEIYDGIMEKISSLSYGGNRGVSYALALDIGKYDGIGHSTAGSVKESKWYQGDFGVDPASQSVVGSQQGTLYKIAILIPPIASLGGNSFIVFAKRVENVRLFLKDMIEGRYLKESQVRQMVQGDNDALRRDLQIAHNTANAVAPFFASVVPRIKGEKKAAKGTGIIRMNASDSAKLTGFIPPVTRSRGNEASPSSTGPQRTNQYGAFAAADGTSAQTVPSPTRSSSSSSSAPQDLLSPAAVEANPFDQ